MPSEFDIVNRYFAQSNLAPPPNDQQLLLGIGDDGALLQPNASRALVLSVDTLVADVHFPEKAASFLIGYRSLAVNVSDLAAMGAIPRYFTLALTLPFDSEEWLSEFAHGLADAAKKYSIYLIGGDTTRGPLSITIQVIGEVEFNCALKRSGAKVGDGIYVTGTLGDAAGGLSIIKREKSVSVDVANYLAERYYQPSARVEVGKALCGVASSAIDISDGLLADLSHILKASGVGARVLADEIPLSTALLSIMEKSAARELALTAGDDYELCFTASPTKQKELQNIGEATGVTITQIGEITTDNVLHCVDEHNKALAFTSLGFRHF